MSKNIKKVLSVIIGICMVASCLSVYTPKDAKAQETLTNVANNRNNYTYMSSNANKPENGEGFLYVGKGFSAINVCNENYGNGNNILGKTATTKPSLYVYLGDEYDISYAKLYQGSTNEAFYNSYCKKYKIYYSTDIVSKDNEGEIEWTLAGECENGTIYNGSSIKIKDAENVSTSGDNINFSETCKKAKSVKIVFDEEYCMGIGNSSGTGVTGTVSFVSFQVYGSKSIEETTTVESTETTTEKESESQIETTTEKETVTESESDITEDSNLYESNNEKISGVSGYASSNLRGSGVTTPLKVGNLTDDSLTSYIIANTAKVPDNPWFAVDLGKLYDINKVSITPGAGNDYANAYPIKYQIQVAKETTNITTASDLDKLTWITAETVTDGELATKAVTFKRKNARYVRIYVESYADYCSLCDLSVFTTDDRYLLGEKEDNHQNVLFIGNSMTYYNNLANVVSGLANYYGHDITCTAATNGGKNLIFQSTADNVVSAVKKGGYEIVVIQDIVGGFDADKHMKGVKAVTELIRQYNPDARIISYMPWPVKGSLITNSLVPYFTYNYIKAARTYDTVLAPAGEAFYEIYNAGYDLYFDDRHPMPLGTFISATSVFYTMFPEEEKKNFNDEKDYKYVTDLIHNNIAYSNGSKTEVYEKAFLNLISDTSYKYSHAVKEAVADKTGKTKYTSVAGEYVDADDEVDKEGLTETTGKVVAKELFDKVNGNIAVGCDAYASSGVAKLAVDGNTGSRWESTHGVDPQWIYVDLGEIKSIDKVGFLWEGAYASKYYVQISDNAQNWNTVAMVSATVAKNVQIDLGQTYDTRYVRMYGTRRGTGYGYSIFEFGVWEAKETNTVTVDGLKAGQIVSGNKFKFGNYKYGYYDVNNKKAYKPNSSIVIDSDTEFVSINLNISMRNGTSIRLANPTGLRFMSVISTENNELNLEQILGDENVIATGTLITTYYLYENNNKVLNKESNYTKLDIKNSGWFNDEVGSFCGSIVNIKKENYNAKFIAAGYFTITYTDGSSTTVYTTVDETNNSRTVAQVATAVKNSNEYLNYTDEQKKFVDMYLE